MTATPHPEPSRLCAMARGTLDEADLAPIVDHIDACPTCRATLDAFAADDPFLRQLRDASKPGGRSIGDESGRLDAARALADDLRSHPIVGESVPRQVGDYEILGEAGRGGMGIVYKARHRKLGRLVAFKVVLAGEFASESQLRRFQLEAELAARVRHPQIVQIDEVGAHEGQPYLVMEWVDGGTLASRLDGRPWPPTEVARLVESLARAVDVAHRRGVVHRDLKPENILLQTDPEVEADRRLDLFAMIPKIADFGLARSLQDGSGLTVSGLMIGTPEYVAPEQFEAGRGSTAGPTTDVYALGILLYQLLAGTPPFRGASPMAVLKAAASTAPVPPRRLQKQIPRDLETVVLRAIEREPSRRYPSAGALASDLRRFLDGKPVLARPSGVRTQLLKWARREPKLAALSALLAAVSIGAFVGVTALWIAASSSRDEAAASRDIARLRGDAERWARYQADVTAASSAIQLNNSGVARRLLDGSPVEHRNWEWSHLASLLDNARSVRYPFAAPDRPTLLALGPDGSRIAAATASGRAWKLWNPAEDPAPIPAIAGFEGTIRSLVFSPDGSKVATALSDKTVRLWDGRSGSPHSTLRGLDQPVAGLVFSPDGSRLAGHHSDRLIVWEVATAARSFEIRNPAAIWGAIEFSSDGSKIAVPSGDLLRQWDARTGAPLTPLRGPGRGMLAYAYSPDGSKIATGARFPDNAVKVWDASTATLLDEFPGHKNSVYTLGFSPDGRRLVSASRDQSLRVWDLAEGRPGPTLKGHTELIDYMAFLGNDRIVSGARDHTLRVWDLESGETLGVLRGYLEPIAAISTSKDGSVIATADARGPVRIWDPNASVGGGILRGHTGFVYDVAFSPDSRTVASASWDGTARTWDVATGRKIAEASHGGSLAISVAFRPDGGEVASGDRAGRILLWDPRSGAVRKSIRVPTISDIGAEVAYSPKGRFLAVLDGPATEVRLFDSTTSEPVGIWPGDGKPTSHPVFNADGSRLATIDQASTVRVRSASSRQGDVSRLPHDQVVNQLAFHPGGGLIASGSKDGKVRFWGDPGGNLRAVLDQGAEVYGLSFNRDGTRLAVGCSDGVIRLWDVARAAMVAELRGHTDYVHAVAFSPDGSKLVSGSGDFTVRLWDTSTRRDH